MACRNALGLTLAFLNNYKSPFTVASIGIDMQSTNNAEPCHRRKQCPRRHHHHHHHHGSGPLGFRATTIHLTITYIMRIIILLTTCPSQTTCRITNSLQTPRTNSEARTSGSAACAFRRLWFVECSLVSSRSVTRPAKPGGFNVPLCSGGHVLSSSRFFRDVCTEGAGMRARPYDQ